MDFEAPTKLGAAGENDWLVAAAAGAEYAGAAATGETAEGGFASKSFAPHAGHMRILCNTLLPHFWQYFGVIFHLLWSGFFLQYLTNVTRFLIVSTTVNSSGRPRFHRGGGMVKLNHSSKRSTCAPTSSCTCLSRHRTSRRLTLAIPSSSRT